MYLLVQIKNWVISDYSYSSTAKEVQTGFLVLLVRENFRACVPTNFIKINSGLARYVNLSLQGLEHQLQFGIRSEHTASHFRVKVLF